MWTTLIICVTLVLLASLALSAWLPYLKWGCDVLRDRGSEGLTVFTMFIRAWPHPMSWVGNAERAVLAHRRIGHGDDGGESNDAATSPEEPTDKVA